MGVFDSKYFNSEVFGQYVETVPKVKQNAFLKAGILRTRNDLKAKFADQTGGNFASIPMNGIVGGDPLNYDGATNITATSLGTYLQSMIVVGRAKAWKERDFSYDITGHDFMAEIAKQVAGYWDDVDQATILAILKGIFGVTTDSFSTKHTLNITGAASTVVGATTLNNAIQQAAGENKSIFTAAVMPSQVATNLENLQLLDYFKYNDANGMQRQSNLASWNGRTVLVDDDCVENGYVTATSSTAGALKVVASGASTNQINLEDVQAADYYPAGVAANDYVLPDVRYVTYLMGQNAFDYVDCGAKNPYETWRDPSTNGGEDYLFTRQRKLFAPRGFSFVQPSSPTPAIVSPTAVNLATAARWTIVTDTAGSGYFDSRAIPFARIISKG